MILNIALSFSIGILLLLFGNSDYDLKNRAEKFSKEKLKKIFPIKVLSNIIYKLRKFKEEEILDREVYEAISFMRNIISIESGRESNADFIIERLSRKEGLLQEVYIKMLSLLRVNKKKEAQKLLESRLNTPSGKEFATLLIKWDDIDPKELVEVLISHQKGIKEMQLTIQKRREESISDLLYLPVIVNVIFLFINFIYVAYFINQKEMLQMLF